jgi:hypothetical protein
MVMEPAPDVPVELAVRLSTLVLRLMLPPLEVAVKEPAPAFKEVTVPTPAILPPAVTSNLFPAPVREPVKSIFPALLALIEASPDVEIAPLINTASLPPEFEPVSVNVLEENDAAAVSCPPAATVMLSKLPVPLTVFNVMAPLLL